MIELDVMVRGRIRKWVKGFLSELDELDQETVMEWGWRNYLSGARAVAAHLEQEARKIAQGYGGYDG